MEHRSGFVNIIGRPNVGKSTLMNALVGEKLSIITHKAQTTRHRILGILNDENHQVIFSDTPGFIKPNYAMQESMMHFVRSSFSDADVILFLTDVYEKELDPELTEKIKKMEVPVILILNKIDRVEEDAWKEKLDALKKELNPTEAFGISALKKTNTEDLLNKIFEYIPEFPPYYPKDALTDKPERFFVSEIVREKILLNCTQEIPYSVEVVTEAFKEEEDIIRIRAEIIVNRKTHKPIIIGKGGQMIKKLGTDARIDMEAFFGKKIFLELFVKIKENWREDPNMLKRFGY